MQQIDIKFYICNTEMWKMYSIKLEVLTAALLRIQVFCDVTLCCWVSGCQH